MGIALIGVGGTIVGVVLGWWLSGRTAREATREEREYQEAAAIRQRREDAAAALREELIEIREKLPVSSMKPEQALDALLKGHRMIRNAWSRASIIRDDRVDQSFKALDMVVFLAVDDSTAAREGRSINYWVLGLAVADLRAMLDAYLLREALPEPQFPSSSEQVEIAGSDDFVLHKIMSEVRARERARRT
jgi:hypothetical protein